MGVSKSRATLTAVLGGTVLDYVEKTSDTNITATAEASATTIVTANPLTFDGQTTIRIEFQATIAFLSGVAGRGLSIFLFDGETSLGYLSNRVNPASASNYDALHVSRRLTPPAGSHTYSIRALETAGAGIVYASAGGAGNYLPAFIRITRESSVIGGTGIAGVQGGFAPLDSGLLIPAAYLPPPLAGYAYRRTAGDYSTSSTSFVDVDATNLKPTLTVQANHRIKVTLQARNSGVAATGSYFQVIIDGTAYRLWYGELQPDGDNCWVVVSPQLAAGARLVNVQYATDSGTFTLSGDADHPLQFVAEELSY